MQQRVAYVVMECKDDQTRGEGGVGVHERELGIKCNEMWRPRLALRAQRV